MDPRLWVVDGEFVFGVFRAIGSSVSATIRAFTSSGQRRRPPRTGSTSTLLRVSVEASIVKLTSCSHRSGEISNQNLNWKMPCPPRLRSDF